MNDTRHQATHFRMGLIALLALLPLVLIKFELSSPPPARFWRHLFDLGHIPLFILIGYITWLGFLGRTRRTGAALVGCLISSLLLGCILELTQLATGRTASWNDLQLNIIGLLLFTAFGPQLLPVNPVGRLLTGGIAFVWLSIQLLPLVTTSVDSYTLHRHPELLSDFESIGQKSRWTRGKLITVEDPAYGKVLRVELNTKRYEGTTLEYLPRDWSNYSTLELHIFSADQGQSELHIKIRDSQAVSDGDHYAMQFNQIKPLNPGWNQILLSLAQIRNSPKNRAMKMDQIHALTLFFVERTYPGYMLVDNLRLR